MRDALRNELVDEGVVLSVRNVVEVLYAELL